MRSNLNFRNLQNDFTSGECLHIFTGTVARTNAFYGRGSGLIMLTNVECNGEEKNLFNCNHTGYGVTSCSHSEDAGVTCPGIEKLDYACHMK